MCLKPSFVSNFKTLGQRAVLYRGFTLENYKVLPLDLEVWHEEKTYS